MSDRIQDAIKEEMQTSVDSLIHVLRFNLTHAFRAILWPGYLAGKISESELNHINKIINVVFATSYLAGPEGEEYPDFDIKAIAESVAALQKLFNLPANEGTK